MKRIILLLLISCILFASAQAAPDNKQAQILNLIRTREAEIEGTLNDLKALYDQGLITLHEAEPYKRELAELQQFEFTVNNPFNSYEKTLKERLKTQIESMGKELQSKKELWEEGLIATKEIERIEEKAALYNYILQYLSDESRFPIIAINQLSLSITKILGKFYPIESKFGFRTDPIVPSRKQFHAGIDFPAFAGVPIKAPAEGVVSKVVTTVSTGGGMQIRLKHSPDIETVYMHLSKIVVGRGKPVKPGDVIGYVGATGTRVTGPHLHFELHLKGIPVDPSKYFTEFQNINKPKLNTPKAPTKKQQKTKKKKK